MYLALMMFLQVTEPMQTYALTSGPTQPEFNSFTPIGTSDMVNLASGDFNYNIPIMDVGGYPINLAYDSGVTMDQEASWVGLGWNLNVGQINRQVRGLPDDFKGDAIRYENDLRKNITIGTNVNVSPAVIGLDIPFSFGLGVQYNNYEGITFKPSVGFSYSMNANASVGFELTTSTGGGATVTPTVGLSGKMKDRENSLTISAGLSSRQGLQNMSISASSSTKQTEGQQKAYGGEEDSRGGKSKSFSGNFTFNSQSYTPSKRVAYKNKNRTFNGKLGLEAFGAEGDVKTSSFGSYQSIAPGYKNRRVGGYGYENTHVKGGNEGVLDFNREKETAVSKNTTALPVTNYTYDIYSIQGQGASGTFRPYRSQVSYLYNDEVKDVEGSSTVSVEVGGANLVHGGTDINVARTTSKTGPWHTRNNARPYFSYTGSAQSDLLYEPVSFRYMGEMSVDNELDLYNNLLHKEKAMNLTLGGFKLFRKLEANYRTKEGVSAAGVAYANNPINSLIKRQERLITNQSVQKITNLEADNKFVFKNKYAQPHHTVGIKVLQPDGTTYIFGNSAYNTSKVEATFDVSGAPDADYINGLISYNGEVHGNGRPNSDEYVNRITTPPYAHTYLVSSILSPDYEDIDNNGPSDEDLGTYTKFNYIANDRVNNEENEIEGIYKWRAPYAYKKVSFNPGLETSGYDEKGNYIYGEKEVKYIKTIETKTHVAVFELDDRYDVMSVDAEKGGKGNTTMKQLDRIRLYSKPELVRALLAQSYEAEDIDFSTLTTTEILNAGVSPIKTAHFDYGYDLCPNIPTHNDFYGTTGPGKLTLRKVYFTYRDSQMGRYTPYEFDYGTHNPAYEMKGFDMWGNYKPNNAALTNTDFPFVDQQNPDQVQDNIKAWTLKKVSLPSGGEIDISIESDDYQYVQDRKAMQMFKVIGAGATSLPASGTDGVNQLFARAGRDHYKYIYVDLGEEGKNIDVPTFIERYLSENLKKQIYFNFHLNMNSHHHDYVSGYLELEGGIAIDQTRGIVGLPLKFVKKEGGISGGSHVNPISKAGWSFGRANLNRAVYSISGDEKSTKFVSVAKELASSIGAVSELFTGPNGRLENKGCAKWFTPAKSWIRLENPNKKKLGGGCRVKRIELKDNWNVMTKINGVEVNHGEYYGQDYSYTLEDGTSSSGVATFEPNASPENPFVEPHYGKKGRYADRISAPRDRNYVEKPFGETFFPSPTVTYSRVIVSNLDKTGDNGNLVVKKHATGKVVTEHYTSKDCPTKVDFTDIEIEPDKIQPPPIFDLVVIGLDHLTASQGFVIETNDMNAKVKRTQVFDEEGTRISGVDYKYNLKEDNSLDNTFTTIDSHGKVMEKILGLDYDVVNDFNESKSVTTSGGTAINVATMLYGIVPVVLPSGFPNMSRIESILRTATTTKVVYKRGVLKEQIAYDLGSEVSTKNLAWDAKTGEILVTETINEFNDKYYSFNYPAYWYYENMGLASDNLGMVFQLKESAAQFYYKLENGIFGTVTSDISKYLKLGDEIVTQNGTRLWVSAYNDDANPTEVKLMLDNGRIGLPADGVICKVMRSGNRNMQKTSMASVTTMKNPLEMVDAQGVLSENIFEYTVSQSLLATSPRVINASAIEYSEGWLSQCENNLPNVESKINGKGHTVNPYKYNIKGDWRPIRSYAYLTGRNNDETTNRRVSGYFTDYKSFYKLNNGEWTINYDPNQTLTVSDGKWQFASEVTKFSPYGVELENQDALERYSSAQYGYEYTLPTAVTSNSEYKEMGADNFEDYEFQTHSTNKKPHFGYKQSLGGDIKITDQKSHTGQRSIAIPAGQRASFERRIDACQYAE